jgi:1,4-alpha-glucan branching enzyme
MGGEFGQWREWNEERSLDWHLLEQPFHKGLQTLLRDINRLYKQEPALWEADSEPAGFEWIEVNDAQGNTLAFMRRSPSTGRRLLCVCNFAPLVRDGYRVGLPVGGDYRLVLNTDAEEYGGAGVGQVERIVSEETPWHGQPFSASVVLPPLSALWFEVPQPEGEEKG